MKEIGVNVDMLLKVGLNDLSVEPAAHTHLANEYYFQVRIVFLLLDCAGGAPRLTLPRPAHSAHGAAESANARPAQKRGQ